MSHLFLLLNSPPLISAGPPCHSGPFFFHHTSDAGGAEEKLNVAWSIFWECHILYVEPHFAAPPFVLQSNVYLLCPLAFPCCQAATKDLHFVFFLLGDFHTFAISNSWIYCTLIPVCFCVIDLMQLSIWRPLKKITYSVQCIQYHNDLDVGTALGIRYRRSIYIYREVRPK